MEAHGADGELALFKQGRVIPPEIPRAETIEAPAGMLTATTLEGVSVASEGGGGFPASMVMTSR